MSVMKKKNRIKRNRDFEEIIDQGITRKNSCFVATIKSNKLDFVRVGISVSKRRGNAVKRNHIRRQIRSICEQKIDFHQSYDLIIVVRKDYDLENFLGMQEQLLALVAILERNIHGKEEK